MADIIKINIKQAMENSFDITVSVNGTVADIKTACAEWSGVKATEMKLIFKGRILKDTDTI